MLDEQLKNNIGFSEKETKTYYFLKNFKFQLPFS